MICSSSAVEVALRVKAARSASPKRGLSVTRTFARGGKTMR